MLARHEEPAKSVMLTIGPGADWLAVGSVMIDLRTRVSLRRIVLALAEQHRVAPGRPISCDDVFAVGWPDERVSPRAAGARVYTAMYTLRRMGLRGILVRRAEGYLLEPAVRVEVTPQSGAGGVGGGPMSMLS